MQVKHPSALGMFDQVVAASKGKQIVVFLDYDGTLSPIVDDPDAAYMSDTVNILDWTCSCGPCRRLTKLPCFNHAHAPDCP